MNKKRFSSVLVIIFAIVVILGIAGYFGLSKKQEGSPIITNIPNSNISRNTQPSTQPITSTLISFPKYDNGTFSIPTTIQQGTEIILRWTSDSFLLGWGDKVYICLIALDTKKEVIEPKENKDLCYPDMQLMLDITTLSSGEYHWFPSNYDNEFISPPKTLKLSVRILDFRPSEGRNEWTGLISESTSNEFVIVP